MLTTSRRLTAAAAALLLASGSARACESLLGLDLGHTSITSAAVMAPGAMRIEGDGRFAAATNAALSSLPSFCRVVAVSRPSSDSEIGLEIWLPSNGWNGMLLAVGNGAWAGTISYTALADAVRAGYAAVSTDTGHVGNDVEFAIDHPEKLVDFAYRAVHEMTVAAKAAVEANYSRPADYAYFSGCSTGGRQALTEVQRFPDDFDGVVAGAAAYYPTHLQGMQVWTAAVAARQPEPPLGEREFHLVNDAVVAACDALDGVEDGVIENPAVCDFDPASLICDGSGSGACLTAAQAETVRMTYAGPTDAEGRSIFPGLSPGSETGWRTLSSEEPLGLAYDTYARLVFDDAHWDFTTFDAERDIATGVERIGDLMDSADPDISAFIAHGGRLLLYHGWADPGIPPRSTIRYYGSVRDTIGPAAADASVRLFMVPGMGHCRGGVGTDRFDPVAALDRWVRTDEAPARIDAAHVEDDRVTRTRPLCPYPSTAVYDGSGSTDSGENFECR